MPVQRYRKLAEYNFWMNGKVYDAAATLGEEDLHRDRGAFFGSIFGTLNHLVVADTIWLKRLAEIPSLAPLKPELSALAPAATLNQQVETTLSALRSRREYLDGLIIRAMEEFSGQDEAFVLTYKRVTGLGEAMQKPMWFVLSHIFNHQTHHRGQVTTLLSQAGLDIGVTDIITLDPEG